MSLAPSSLSSKLTPFRKSALKLVKYLFGLPWPLDSVIQRFIMLVVFFASLIIAENTFTKSIVTYTDWISLEYIDVVVFTIWGLYTFALLKAIRSLSFFDVLIWAFLLHFSVTSEKFVLASSYYLILAAIYYLLLIGLAVRATIRSYRGAESKSYLSLDDPLSHEEIDKSGDLLNQNLLSTHIVSALANLKVEKRAYVVGIEGPWGIGKTTFLSKLVKKSREMGLDVVAFNPWYFSNLESLTDSFFKTLNQHLGLDNDVLKAYSKAILDTEEKILPIKLFGYAFESRASLEKSKERINNQLGLRQKPLLVAIDEIDRLTKDELYQTLRLIRVIADFKNIIYVVLYDQEFVQRSIEDLFPTKSKSSYLDKIFQVTFTLPPIKEKVLKNYLLETVKVQIESKISRDISNETNNLIRKYKEKYLTDTVSQIKLITDDDKTYPLIFSNIRDVKKFVNNLLIRFYVDMYEVNLHDLFYLELLRSVSPDAYAELYDSIGKKRIRIISETDAGVMKFSEMVESEDAFVKEIFSRMEQSQQANPIKYANHFFKYFTFNLSDRAISNTEFYVYLDKIGSEEFRNKWSFWINSEYGGDLLLKIKNSPQLTEETILKLLNETIKTYSNMDVQAFPRGVNHPFRQLVLNLLPFKSREGVLYLVKQLLQDIVDGEQPNLPLASFLFHESVWIGNSISNAEEVREYHLNLLNRLLDGDFNSESYIFIIDKLTWHVKPDNEEEVQWFLLNTYHNAEFIKRLAPNIESLFSYLKTQLKGELEGDPSYSDFKREYFNSIFLTKKAIEGNPLLSKCQTEIKEFLALFQPLAK